MGRDKWKRDRKVTEEGGASPRRTSGTGAETLDFARCGIEKHQRLNKARESHDPIPDWRTLPWLLVQKMDLGRRARGEQECSEGVPPGVQARSDGGQMAHVGAAGFSSGSALQVEMAGTGDGS